VVKHGIPSSSHLTSADTQSSHVSSKVSQSAMIRQVKLLSMNVNHRQPSKSVQIFKQSSLDGTLVAACKNSPIHSPGNVKQYKNQYLITKRANN